MLDDLWDYISDKILAADAVAVGMLFRYGKFTVDNLIHLVLDSTNDLQPTLWYICEFNSWRNSENWPITRPKSSSPSSSFSSSERDAATAAKKDLSILQEEKQDQQLIQREKDLEQKEKNLAQKETLLQQKLLQAELREREALEFEQEAKIKLEEVDEKEQELEAEKLALKKNKYKGTTSSIPTHHDAENADDDENPTTNETNDNDNQWLLRFSNLQQRLEIAYREIENLRRPVFPAAETTTTITTATANGDNDNNDNNDNDNDDEDDDNEKSSSIITSLQHELKVTKENAQKQKEENVFLWEKLKDIDNQGRRSKMDCDEEASSVGNRWAPLNFRVERMRWRGDSEMMMSTTTGRREGEEEEEEEGIVGMIEMQKEFRFLGRLR